MERRTLASSTSSSNNRNSPPPEDAWINTYRKLLPEWQSIAASQQVPYYSIISLYNGPFLQSNFREFCLF